MNYLLKSLAIFILLISKVCAQPVFQANMPPYGYGTTMYLAANVTSPGSGGAGVTWDFSFQGAMNFIGYLEYINIGGTEFEVDFPTSNLVARKRIAGDTTYTYYTNLGSELIINGENMGAVNQSKYISNTKQLFTFPMNYGDSLMDSWQSTNTIGRVHRYYDGYGTLITAYGTYNNIARIKSVDSALIGATWTETVTYTWYTTDALVPIAQFHVPSQQMTILKMFPVSAPAMKRPNNISLFPNPLTHHSNLIINNLQAKTKLRITNTLGQVVRVEDIHNSPHRIERGQLNSGIYFYTIDSPEGHISSGKLVIE